MKLYTWVENIYPNSDFMHGNKYSSFLLTNQNDILKRTTDYLSGTRCTT